MQPPPWYNDEIPSLQRSEVNAMHRGYGQKSTYSVHQIRIANSVWRVGVPSPIVCSRESPDRTFASDIDIKKNNRGGAYRRPCDTSNARRSFPFLFFVFASSESGCSGLTRIFPGFSTWTCMQLTTGGGENGGGRRVSYAMHTCTPLGPESGANSGTASQTHIKFEKKKSSTGKETAGLCTSLWTLGFFASPP